MIDIAPRRNARMTTKKSATKKSATKKSAAKKTRRTKQRWNVGDVFQIALARGRYAYGRIYGDAAVGIYRTITKAPCEPPIGSNDLLFTVGMYADVLDYGRVTVVGSDPFPDRESEWPPPSFIKDTLSGEYSLYHKGVITPSTRRRCAKLEAAAVWDLEDIVERIEGSAAAG